MNRAIILLIAPFVFSLLSYVFGMLANKIWKDYVKINQGKGKEYR